MFSFLSVSVQQLVYSLSPASRYRAFFPVNALTLLSSILLPFALPILGQVVEVL